VPTVVRGSYEWDEAKAASNLEKHGVSFEEAASALEDPNAAYIDASTSSEERFAAIGLSAAARVLYVIHVERRRRDRIISARVATAAERIVYENG